MPSPLDERFQPFRKHAAAAALFEKGVGICTDLRLKEIEISAKKHLNELGKRQESAKAANENAIRLNGHLATVNALTKQAAGAKAKLRSAVFSPDSVKLPPEWRTRAFDYIESMGGEGSRVLSENPELLHVAMTAPIPLRNVTRAEVIRIADAHVATVRPAESAHIESETAALEIVGAQLEIAVNAIRHASGHGGNLTAFEVWLRAPERQPTPETQRALSSEIAKAESEAILRSAATWDEADRKALWDALMDVRIEAA